MKIDMKKALIGLSIALAAVLTISLLVGPIVTVDPTSYHYGSGNSRYLLNVHDVEGTIRFSIMDSKDGNTYIFRQEDATHVVPPAQSKDLIE